MAMMIDETNPDAEVQKTIENLRAAGTRLADLANAGSKPGNLAFYENILEDLFIQVASLQTSLIEPDFDAELKKALLNDARANIERIDGFFEKLGQNVKIAT